MKMNRRNVLIGIGTVAVGSGVALGSGAFTSVEANRTVNLGTSNDASALLTLKAGSGATSIVGTESDQGVDMLQLNQQDLNEDAITRFENAIEVVNNGTEDVGLYVDESTSGVPDPLEFESGGSSITGSGNAASAADLNSLTSVEVDIVIDLTGATQDTDLPQNEVTFVAEVGAHS